MSPTPTPRSRGRCHGHRGDRADHQSRSAGHEGRRAGAAAHRPVQRAEGRAQHRKRPAAQSRLRRRAGVDGIGGGHGRCGVRSTATDAQCAAQPLHERESDPAGQRWQRCRSTARAACDRSRAGGANNLLVRMYRKNAAGQQSYQDLRAVRWRRSRPDRSTSMPSTAASMPALEPLCSSRQRSGCGWTASRSMTSPTRWPTMPMPRPSRG